MLWFVENFNSSLWWIQILLTLWIIFLGRYKPARSTLMWVMIQAILPIFGFILYLLFGLDNRKAHTFRIKASLDNQIHALTELQRKHILNHRNIFTAKEDEDYSELAALNLHNDKSVLTEKNECQIFFDGKEKFRKLFEDIDQAKKSIDLQYYIVKSDKLGNQLFDHLIRASQRGVAVRILVDGVGGRNFKNRDRERLKKAGCKLAIFYPSIFKYINLRLNYRNHRKIVVIDDYIGYIGGFNVGDEYIGKDKRFGYWRDTHLRLYGEGSLFLKTRFLQDWYYSSKEDPEEERNPELSPEFHGGTYSQIVTSGPDTLNPNIKYTMLKMIQSANEVIYIQSPYLVLDRSFLDALKIAISQGVEVNIMIPNKPDHIIVYWATTSYAGELLKAGAKVYRYERGFLHSKVLIVDHFLSLVGSANMDERSFSLNFEASALLYSYEINKKLREQFDQDLQHSTHITQECYEKRPLMQKIKEPIARLFSPLL